VVGTRNLDLLVGHEMYPSGLERGHANLQTVTSPAVGL
jgi:hypothetical protein